MSRSVGPPSSHATHDGLTPGQGAVTAREDPAAVPHGQGEALAGRDDSGGPADLQGLGRSPSQDRRQPPGRRPEPGGQGAVAGGVVVVVAAGVVVVVVVATAGLVLAVVAAGVVVAVVAAGSSRAPVGLGAGG